MIVRIWHGWTAPEDADAYEAFLGREIADGFLTDPADGFLGVEVLRRDAGPEIAFVTVMRFASWDAVAAFAGPDPEVAVVPDEARSLLTRFDDRAAHYEHRLGA